MRLCALFLELTSHYRDSSWAIGSAMATLEQEAGNLGADGVIGVNLSLTSTYDVSYTFFHAAVMGTAIRFA